MCTHPCRLLKVCSLRMRGSPAMILGEDKIRYPYFST
jgi:hypothetical protein